MSRWIEYEPLMAELEREVELSDDWKTAREIANVAKYAPSIDIVRCGECKWRNAKMMPKSVKCLFSGKDDDFCSYGEREGE